MWSCLFRCGFTSLKICCDCYSRNWDPWRPHNWRVRPGMPPICDGFGWTDKVSLSLSLPLPPHPTLFLCLCMVVYACAKDNRFPQLMNCICLWLLLSWLSSIFSIHSDLLLEWADLLNWIFATLNSTPYRGICFHGIC